jgi:hypothetical protein
VDAQKCPGLLVEMRDAQKLSSDVAPDFVTNRYFVSTKTVNKCLHKYITTGINSRRTSIDLKLASRLFSYSVFGFSRYPRFARTITAPMRDSS